jgi:hypothetical protein
MTKTKSIIYSIGALILFSSCSSIEPSNSDTFLKINKNTTIENFKKDFSDRIADSTTVNLNNNQYTFLSAIFVSYFETKSSHRSDPFGGSPGFSRASQDNYSKSNTLTTSSISNSGNYLLVFENGKFFYSGFLYEFNLESNPTIKRLRELYIEKSSSEKK